MPQFTAFYDANVLYPAELRNFLMHLALSGLFHARWSADVHEEWIASLLRQRPDLRREQLDRTRELMDRHATGALVTGYRDLISTLDLPDPNDRHVLAAAIRGRATVLATMNLRDFPLAATAPFGIKPEHPDDFVLRLFALSSQAVVAAARNHRESLRNPPKTVTEYLLALERQGLARTAAALRERATEF